MAALRKRDSMLRVVPPPNIEDMDPVSILYISTEVGFVSHDDYSFLLDIHISTPSAASVPLTSPWMESSSKCSISSYVGVFCVNHLLCTYGVDRGSSFQIVNSSSTSMVNAAIEGTYR